MNPELKILLDFILLYLVEHMLVACTILLIIFAIIIGIYELITFIKERIKFYTWKKKQKPYEDRLQTIRTKRRASKINELYRKAIKENR